jgi:hypothetical protein
MDVTLDALAGDVETAALGRTDAREGADPIGVFDALIAALSKAPVAEPPAPPVVWSGDFGLPTLTVTSDAALAAPASEDEAVTEMPVTVPLHLIAGVVAAVPTVAALESAVQEVQTDAVMAPARATPPPAAPTPPPVTSPTVATPADAPPAIVPFRVTPQADATDFGTPDVEAPAPLECAGVALNDAPLRPAMKTMTPEAVATYQKAVAPTPAPRVATVEQGTVAASALRVDTPPEPSGAPVSATVAPALHAPAMVAPAQVVDTHPSAPVAPAAPTMPAPQARPTTEDGQPLEARLVEVMRWQAKEGGGRVEMKLRPEYLGAMTVTVQVEGGVVKASLAAESQSTRDFLQAEAGHLKTALEDHGFTLETFEVRDEREAPEEHRQQRQHQQHGSKRPTRDSGTAESGETFDVIV